MKKKILTSMLIFALWILCVSAAASPFLVCDPPAAGEQITHYEIYQDGALIAATSGTEPDASLKYDLDGVAAGQYEFTAKACNTWGCSDFSNPTQSPPAASAPAGLDLIK